MDKIVIKKSIRDFVETVLITGSIDTRYLSATRAQEGIRAHKRLQQGNEELYDKYEKEVPLSIVIREEKFNIELQGRCDGIIYEGEGMIVEEIKSTYVPLVDIKENYKEVHWAQSKIYAYILMINNNLRNIEIQLSYYNLDSHKVKSFRKMISLQEGKEYLYDLINSYIELGLLDLEHKKLRQESIGKMTFPFDKYRKGQLEVAKSCYSTIKEGEIIFIEAPTGIGKTISTIFPSLKALGNGYGERIVYLTSKNINKKVCRDTINILRGKNLIVRDLVLTAKEKICLNDKVACNPEECIYAKDYYDKIKKIIPKILKKEKSISRELLEYYGKEYGLCPFELSLDLIKWVDILICDYNYIFEPRIALKRIVEEGSKDNIFLVDECHNLLDRGRGMYSASIDKESFLLLKKECRGKAKELGNICNKINNYLIEERRVCQGQENQYYYTKNPPKELFKLLKDFMIVGDKILSEGVKYSFGESLLELYFKSSKFLSIGEIYDEEYYTYSVCEGNNVEVTLFCANPSEKLRSVISKGRSGVLFSATLFPFQYYIQSIGGKVDDYRLRLESPFDKENLKVYNYPVNIRYRHRDKTINEVKKVILEFIKEEKGNYLVFAPSYEYLGKLHELFKEDKELFHGMLQKRESSEEERIDFLKEFSKGRNNVGFCVIGGGYSEGVDLPGEELIGAIIIGVGYPRISIEGQLIKEHFKEYGELYSYIYPGINKVMQSVGRVIRRENDKGRVLLIDDRYRLKPYMELLPKSWQISQYRIKNNRKLK